MQKHACILTPSGLLQETRQEGKAVWNMFKEDPLAPAAAYWRNYGMPGIGLFLEGYVVGACCQFAVLLAALLVLTCSFVSLACLSM